VSPPFGVLLSSVPFGAVSSWAAIYGGNRPLYLKILKTSHKSTITHCPNEKKCISLPRIGEFLNINDDEETTFFHADDSHESDC
jgi:hypothetical protein